VTYHHSWLPDSWGDLSTTASASWHGTAPAGVPAASIAGIPSYVVVDLSATWANMFGKPIDLGFWMKNVADNVYVASCLDNRLTLGQLSCRFARQRSFGFSLKYRFGAEGE
jgi:outer membrane receptor protein involved in Fe transport